MLLRAAAEEPSAMHHARTFLGGNGARAIPPLLLSFVDLTTPLAPLQLQRASIYHHHHNHRCNHHHYAPLKLLVECRIIAPPARRLSVSQAVRARLD